MSWKICNSLVIGQSLRHPPTKEFFDMHGENTIWGAGIKICFRIWGHLIFNPKTKFLENVMNLMFHFHFIYMYHIYIYIYIYIFQKSISFSTFWISENIDICFKSNATCTHAPKICQNLDQVRVYEWVILVMLDYFMSGKAIPSWQANHLLYSWCSTSTCRGSCEGYHFQIMGRRYVFGKIFLGRIFFKLIWMGIWLCMLNGECGKTQSVLLLSSAP